MPKKLLLPFFILLKFVLQYSLISPHYDLHRDEYLHLDQAKHLAWGYLSVPPFTSWISWIILQLGNGVFWVKFFPALFGVLTLWLVWEIIREAGGGLFARCLGATVIVFSALMRLNMLYQPNSADVFFWTLLYFALIKQFSSGNPKWLYLAAMAFGFGFLNKYNIAFLAAGVFPALLIARRNIFKTKELYLAAGLALLIISPNLFWQYANGFPVIGHMNELAETQLVNVDRADFVKEQLLFFIGSIYVIVAGLIAPFFRNLKTYRFVPLSFAFTIALFIYCRAKGYYAIGLYPVIIALGAAYLEMLLQFAVEKVSAAGSDRDPDIAFYSDRQDRLSDI
jgi:4-amino-4-deoxy-L-arabinose transferase-like glycosyltransferase